MIPIVSIVGRSNSGKTVLIERLIPEMKRRGYRVATIKHDAHSFEIDKEGKDSWRHAKAGAEMVTICSQKKFAMIRKTPREMPLEKIIASFIDEVDIIITEGYKSGSYPKVEVSRENKSGYELLCQRDNDNLVAIVSDREIDSGDTGVPSFAFHNTSGIVDFLEEKLMNVEGENVHSVHLSVNGKKIGINRFAGNMINKTILGMISSLKGVEEPRWVDIRIEVEKQV